MFDSKQPEQTTLILLALKTLSCSQKDLAKVMDVSTTQITKWKQGEGMAADKIAKIREECDLSESDNAEFILAAGSKENAIFWADLLEFLNRLGRSRLFEGPQEWPFDNNDRILAPQVFGVLLRMGVEIPQEIPKELAKCDFKKAYAAINKDVFEASELVETCEDAIESNPVSQLIDKLLKCYVDVYYFYTTHIATHLLDDKLKLDITESSNMDYHLMDLAAAKLADEADLRLSIAMNYEEFKLFTLEGFRDWISTIKHAALRYQVPLSAELMDLINMNRNQLRIASDAEWLGDNDERVHPDIYINEILVGIRRINKVLPAILEKLGIDEDSLPEPN